MSFIATIALLLCFSYTISSAGDGKTFSSIKPFVFIENIGQMADQNFRTRTDIQYAMMGAGINIFIGAGHLHYQFSKAEGLKVSTYRVDVFLDGSNPNAEVIQDDLTDYQEQYYQSETGSMSAKGYQRLTYKNIYPGIDWVLYIRYGKLEYDFVVHPGADANNIRLTYEGATSLLVNKDGSITAFSPFGTIKESAPYSYVKETKEAVASVFHLHDNTLTFKTEKSHKTLIIDPVLEWATYFGGSDDDNTSRIATDYAGNIYIAGTTSSTNNIATTGAHQQTFSAVFDCFLVKYNALGQKQWATYLGGTGLDIFTDLAINSSNEIVVVGHTASSTNISTTGSYQPNLSGIVDVVIAKFNSSGQLQWSTYFGGSSVDRAHGVTVDALSNIYIAGQTNSNDNISTIGAFQYTPSLGSDAFIVKFNNAGQRVWGTYIGGNGVDQCYDITYDQGSHSLYTTGYTTSTNVFATLGTHQQNNLGQCAYVEKFDTTGQRIWGTYYGGGDFDRGDAICTDALGNIYIGGSTRSTDSIGTPGVFQSEIAGGQYIGDAFIAKFNSSGIRLWGSYYGSEDNFDFGRDVICDSDNNVWFTGNIPGTSLVGTQGSYQPINAGGVIDAFLVRFNSNGKRIYGTFYGGTDADDGSGIAISNNVLYLGGSSRSTANIATTGSDQSTFGGGPYDAFLVKLHSDTTVVIAEPFNDTVLCQGDQFSVDYSTSGVFQNNNIFTLQLSDANGSFTTPTNIGSLTSNVSGIITGTIPASMPAGIGYRIRIVSSNVLYTSYDNGKDIEVRITPATPVAISNSPVCSGTPINLVSSTTTNGASFAWSGPNAFSSTTQNLTLANATTTMAGDYVVTAILNGCVSEPDTTNVVVTTSSAAAVNITASPGTNINMGQNVVFTANVTNGNTPTYQWRLNGTDLIGETNSTYASSTLANGDVISVMIHATGTCLIPDSALSNQLTISVSNSVNKIDSKNQITLFPNPNTGEFTITGLPKSKSDIHFEVLNTLGQSVFSQTYVADKSTRHFVLDKKIQSGNYILRIVGDGEEVVQPFTIK